jgi:L-ascorbate metabolism protein UlaG (beta-lactamase superfamily)
MRAALLYSKEDLRIQDIPTPDPGLEEWLHARPIDVALLPVNGRDEFRRSRNVPGNFTLEEAVGLCHQVNIPIMIGHHFGMFEFNTVNVEETEHHFQHIRQELRGGLAKSHVKYVFSAPVT